MEAVDRKIFNVKFTPITIQETGDPSCIQIEQIVKIFFDNIETLECYSPHCMYILEHEIEGQFTGDFDPQTMFPNFLGPGERRDVGHHPLTHLKRLKKDFTGVTSLQDRVSVMLDKRKPAANGDLTWNIPTLLYNAKGHLDKITTDPKEYPDIIELEGEPPPELFQLAHRVEIVQKFSLQNSFLQMEKHGTILLQHNLKLLGFN